MPAYDVFEGDNIAACWIFNVDWLITYWTIARSTGNRTMKSNAIPKQAPMIEVTINHLRLYRWGLGAAAGNLTASVSAGWCSDWGISASVWCAGALIVIPAGVVLANGSANKSNSDWATAEPAPEIGAAWPVTQSHDYVRLNYGMTRVTLPLNDAVDRPPRVWVLLLSMFSWYMLLPVEGNSSIWRRNVAKPEAKSVSLKDSDE